LRLARELVHSARLELATVQAPAHEEGPGSYGVWACLWDALRALVLPAAALLSADKPLGFTFVELIAVETGKAIALGHRAYTWGSAASIRA